MTYNLLRAFAAAAIVVACAPSSAASRTKDSTTSAAATASKAAAAPAARDSVSDRADRGRILGDSTASLWVIMASDFQCPFCKQWHDADFKRIVDGYVKTGRVRLAFLNMPLSMHQFAVPAAEAAMCASVQNKFWPMHEALFSTQQRWESVADPAPIFDSLATSAGVNIASWRTCVKDHLTLPLIQADHDRVAAAHVNSTPTFFVGDDILAGADKNVAKAIDAALAKAPSGKKPAS